MKKTIKLLAIEMIAIGGLLLFGYPTYAFINYYPYNILGMASFLGVAFVVAMVFIKNAFVKGA